MWSTDLCRLIAQGWMWPLDCSFSSSESFYIIFGTLSTAGWALQGNSTVLPALWGLVSWDAIYFFYLQLLESYDYVRISAFTTMKSRFLAVETAEKNWQMSPPKGSGSEDKRKGISAVSKVCFFKLTAWLKNSMVWGPTIDFRILGIRHNTMEFLKREKIAPCFSHLLSLPFFLLS